MVDCVVEEVVVVVDCVVIGDLYVLVGVGVDDVVDDVVVVVFD